MSSASQPHTATEQNKLLVIRTTAAVKRSSNSCPNLPFSTTALSSTAAPRNSRASTIPYVRNSRTSKLCRSFLLQKVITPAFTGPAQ